MVFRASSRNPLRAACRQDWRSRCARGDRDVGERSDPARMARLRRRSRQLQVQYPQANQQVERGEARCRVDVPLRRNDVQSDRGARRDLRKGPQQLAGRARRRDREGNLDSRRPRGDHPPRHELLGEQGREGSPAHLQHQRLPPGESTRRPASRSSSLARTASSICAMGLDAIQRRSVASSRIRPARSSRIS